jgi:hypothetical protein
MNTPKRIKEATQRAEKSAKETADSLRIVEGIMKRKGIDFKTLKK